MFLVFALCAAFALLALSCVALEIGLRLVPYVVGAAKFAALFGIWAGWTAQGVVAAAREPGFSGERIRTVHA